MEFTMQYRQHTHTHVLCDIIFYGFLPDNVCFVNECTHTYDHIITHAWQQ